MLQETNILLWSNRSITFGVIMVQKQLGKLISTILFWLISQNWLKSLTIYKIWSETPRIQILSILFQRWFSVQRTHELSFIKKWLENMLKLKFRFRHFLKSIISFLQSSLHLYLISNRSPQYYISAKVTWFPQV